MTTSKYPPVTFGQRAKAAPARAQRRPPTALQRAKHATRLAWLERQERELEIRPRPARRVPDELRSIAEAVEGRMTTRVL